MLKNYILLALFFAICWNFKAEAIMGMSASKALSYSNTISGSKAVSENNSIREVKEKSDNVRSSFTATKEKDLKKKKADQKTHMVTMADTNVSRIEKKYQILKANEKIEVVLPEYSWSVDMGYCEGTKNMLASRILFLIKGIKNAETSCEIKFYGYNAETDQVLNKILKVTIE